MKKAAFEEKIRHQQPQIFGVLSKAIAKQRLIHAYLFAGEIGVGKHTFAKWFGKAQFCRSVDETGLPCLTCNACVRIEEGIHPDVLTIAPAGKTIKVEQIRALKKELNFSGFESNRKVIFIREAEKMNVNSQNRLLKFLEEPHENVTIFLETTDISRLLSTVVSRTQPFFFRSQPFLELTERLQETGIAEKESRFWARLSNDLEQICEFSQDETIQQIKQLVHEWAQLVQNRDLLAFVFVGAKLIPAVKEREKQRLVLGMFRSFWQESRSEQENIAYAHGLENILQAERKLECNVSFQNVCEQLVLTIEKY